jgi:hypothetical protein
LWRLRNRERDANHAHPEPIARRVAQRLARRHSAITPAASEQEMREVVEIVKVMGPEQLFLALVFLAGYALALGEFAGARGRLAAAAAALCSAVGFAAMSQPWEAGVVLVGFAPVGMGLFSATVWALSLATRSAAEARSADDQLPAANLPRTRATSSPRSVNTAPILNSPAAE